MATKFFVGAAPRVAQIANATFGVYDAATTRRITIGGLVIGAADSGGTLTTALAALAVLLNASTDPRFSTITWTSNATQIIGTSDSAGLPFVFVASVTGGTGTVPNTYTVTTASSGPNDWSIAANWSDGVVPVSTDTVILADSNTAILWGLDQSAVTLAKLTILQTFTGYIGNGREIVTLYDGSSTSDDAPEYRGEYLKIGATILDVGQNFSPGSPAGSGRIKINLGTVQSLTTVYNTALVSENDTVPAVRLLCNHASTVVYVRSAPGGVGIAVDTPGETSLLSKVSVSDNSTSSRVFVGSGVTLTTWEQTGGNNLLNSITAGTVATVLVNGGNLQLEGDYVVTAMTLNAGAVIDNHKKSSGNAITTLNLKGGSIDFQQSTEPRTVATVNFTDGTLKADGTILTITTLVQPAVSGNYTLQGTMD